MSVPDRSAETAAIVAQHRELFGTDDSRRAILYWICDPVTGLNRSDLDHGLWGLLLKADRDNFIPSDVIVWRPTLTTVDVLAGPSSGWPAGSPSWQVQGTIDGVIWQWIVAPLPGTHTPPAVPQGPVPQGPPPTPIEPYPDENTWWTIYERRVAALYLEAGRPFPDRSAFRWFSRAAYDIGRGLPAEASAIKHLAELRAALGLPNG